MDFGKFHFGRIEIDGATYERDVVIDRGKIRLGIEAPRDVPVFRQELLPLKAQAASQAVATPALSQ